MPARVPPSHRPAPSAGADGERVQHARAVAAACHSLAELEAALEGFDGCRLQTDRDPAVLRRRQPDGAG